MTNFFFRNAILGLLILIPGVFAQDATLKGKTAGNNEILPLSEVKEGMRATARSVFKGTEPEEFNVEILGVVPGGVGPKQDLIVGRLSGGAADRTGVFAGMSGSPVYYNGKLIGAIAYSFPFSKEPICGITPIEQMIAIFEQRSPAQAISTEPNSFSFGEMVSSNESDWLSSRSAYESQMVSGMLPNSMLVAVAGQTFRPIATPITFSGFDQAALDRFAPQLIKAGLMPVAATGGTTAVTPMKKAEANTLTGGRSVTMHLARGDYGMAASGTVTLRDGEKVYAFGHPFLGLGTSDLAMSESHVVTVVPSVNNSFKLAVSDSLVGSMMQDRATGVFGKLGVSPKMIPIMLSLTTSRGQVQTLNFEIARDETLTPLLLNIAIYNTLLAQERSIGDSTIVLNGEIKVAKKSPIRLMRRFSGGQAFQIAAGAASAPVGAILRGQFADLDFESIDLAMKVHEGSSIATLERIAIDRTQVRPGETISVQAFARTNSGTTFVHNIPVTIDQNTPAGTYSLTIGDGSATQRSEAIQQFVPKDLNDMIATINSIRMPDRLYAKISRTSSGAVIGTSEMPNLPPSVMATLNNDRMAGGTKPVVQTTVKVAEIPPAKFIISGEQTLSFEVIK